MNQAIVITSFGTSVPEARIGITAVEEALADAAADYTCIRAFTSPTIRRILADRGEMIPGLTEALQRLASEGMQKVIVQPTHLLYGYEYDKLKAEAEALGDCFEWLTVGRPLLADSEDIQKFAARLSEDSPSAAGEAYVFMGHGTEHFANAVYPALQTALHLLGRDDIYIGTVEGWPGLRDILCMLGVDSPRRVRLQPLMLVAGDHARNDMDIEWKKHLEQAGHSVICSFTGLGERAWVQEMYRKHLEDFLQ